MSVSGAILAGGRGERFGKEKTEIILGGEVLIRRILRVLKKIFDEVLVVEKSSPLKGELDENTKCVRDMFNSSGAIVGIHSALFHSKNEYSFVCACDMPFVDREFIEFMISEINKNKEIDVLIPESRKGLEPLYAIYSKRCLPFFEKLIREGERKVVNLLKFVRFEVIPYKTVEKFNRYQFFNINTPRDLKRAEAILKNFGISPIHLNGE